MRTHLHLVCAALAVLLAFAAPRAHAQSTTTAAITGSVADETGEPLPGATVLAVHEPSGTEYRAATRGDGGYDLRGLRVGGPYTVTATFLGLTESVQSGVQLALGRTETLDFVLSENARTVGEAVVTADASQVISASRTGAATVVSEETIEAIPTISRSIADFARLNPLASGGGSSSIGGRNNRYNNIQVDGATLNDVFGLAGSGTPGGQSGTQPISIDAIAEFNVEVAPYDVRQSGFTGGLINAVTKSGTNDFAGSVRFLGRDQSLVGDRVSNGALVPFGDFREGLGVFTLGGPILRDKLFFFVSGELERRQQPDNTGFLLPGQVPDGNTFRLPADSLQRVIDVAQARYNYNAGGFNILDTNRESDKVLAKIDWNISPNNRFSIRHNYVRGANDTGVSRSQGAFDLGARRYQFASTQNSTAAQLNTSLGSGAANEARFVFTAVRDARTPSGELFPETQIRVTPNETIRLGIDRFSQANSLDQNLFEFTNDFTLFRGDHTVTLGTNNQFWSFNNLFIQDYYGSYEFAPIDEKALNLDANGNGIPNEQISATEAFGLGLPSRYLFSYASQYDRDASGNLRYECLRAGGVCTDAQLTPARTIDTGEQPRAAFDALQLGFYIQDEWRALPNLRLTGGLRLDVPIFPQTPVENPLVSGGTGVRSDGTTFDIEPAFGEGYTTTNTGTGNPLFSPRLGFNYRTAGLGRQALQIRGGTGLFTGRTPFVWISNQFSNTGADVARIETNLAPGAFDLNRDGILSADERGFFPGTANPADQPTPLTSRALAPVQTTEINLIDPDFKFPQVFRTNVGLDQELPYGFVATIEGLYSKSINDVVYRNLNLTQVGQSVEGQDVRPVYRRNSNAFTNALLLENSSAGYEYSGVLQLQRRVARGLGGSLSYTYNRSENVNNGSSSRAISNWQFNENLDVNNPRLGTTDFEVRHRILSYLSFSTRYARRFSTEFGLVLDTQAGEPYSWIINGDANGDGQRFNDLAFVPESPDQIFLDTGNYDLLNAFIESQPGLRNARGTVVGRNESRAPWTTRLDLEVNQGFETVRGQRVNFEVTLINALNFIDNSWGRIRGTAFNNLNLYRFKGYVTEAQVGGRIAGVDRIVTADDIGKPIVSFDERTVRDDITGDAFSTSDFASRWQLRFGVRYTF